jgi:hypothetical protein
MKKLVILILTLFLPGLARAQVIYCPSGFSASGACGVSIHGGTDSFWSGGNASLSDTGVLVLPTGSDHQVSTLIYQPSVLNVQAFTASFTFVLNGQNVSFVLQNSTNNPYGFNNNIFSAGAGCESGFFQGYSQNNPPNNVFAMELDSYDDLLAGQEDGNQPFTYSSVQIYQSNLPPSVYPNIYVQCPCIGGSDICGVNTSPSDGNHQINKLSTSPVPLNSPANVSNTTTGDTYSATITYDGSNFTLNLYDVTAGGSCPGSSCFTNTWTNVNIPNSVGANTAWVGFTAGTNSLSSSYPLYIDSFVYTVGTPTSTPSPSATTTPTSTATATATPKVTATPTPMVTSTPIVTATATPAPTSTPAPKPTLTATPNPPLTPTPNPPLTPTPNAPLTPTPNSTTTPAPKVSAAVSMSRSSVNFGTVKVGEHKSRVVKLTNTAKKKTGTVVTFDGASVAGSNEISASTNCDGSVGPKQKCSVEIGFAPIIPGAVSATVTVNGNASNNPQTIGVKGTGN